MQIRTWEEAAMIRTLQLHDWWRLTGWFAILVLFLGAVPCGAQQLPSPGAVAGRDASASAGGSRLIAAVLDDVDTYFLEPVSTRRVAVAGMARLEGLDGRLAVREMAGGGGVA